MTYKTRKLVSPPDMNPANTLFGGQLLKWIDEEVAIYSIVKLGTNNVVTKFISEINFLNPAFMGDIVEIGTEIIGCGRSSITMRCDVRVKGGDTTVLTIDKIVFVHVDRSGRPKPHNKTMEDFTEL